MIEFIRCLFFKKKILEVLSLYYWKIIFNQFSRFNALFIRPNIRGAIREYQTKLIQEVKGDIDELQVSYQFYVLAICYMLEMLSVTVPNSSNYFCPSGEICASVSGKACGSPNEDTGYPTAISEYHVDATNRTTVNSLSQESRGRSWKRLGKSR